MTEPNTEMMERAREVLWRSGMRGGIEYLVPIVAAFAAAEREAGRKDERMRALEDAAHAAGITRRELCEHIKSGEPWVAYRLSRDHAIAEIRALTDSRPQDLAV